MLLSWKFDPKSGNFLFKLKINILINVNILNVFCLEPEIPFFAQI